MAFRRPDIARSVAAPVARLALSRAASSAAEGPDLPFGVKPQSVRRLTERATIPLQTAASHEPRRKIGLTGLLAGTLPAGRPKLK